MFASQYAREAFADLADAYSALAASEPPHPDERQQYWREARGVYVQAWKSGKPLSRGALTGEDATKPHTVVQRIAECDAALRAVSARQ